MFFRKKAQQQKKLDTKSYYFNSNKANWSDTSYSSLAKNGYLSNVIANRCINLISNCINSITPLIYSQDSEITNTHLNEILKTPSNSVSYSDFMHNVVKNLMIFGNAYIKIETNEFGQVSLLQNLQADKVSVVSNKLGIPMQYLYKNRDIQEVFDFGDEMLPSNIIHIKNFNPVDDIYGASPLYVSRFAIDQYNESVSWNKALLQNGARPSGALVVESNGSNDNLTDDQFNRLKDQLSNEFSSGKNAGKIMLLEGGLKWQEMSVSPKDMDFIETKNSSARDIALAFGIPSNLIGIPGDNTYSNMSEARISLWEETILPLFSTIMSKISHAINIHEEINIQIKPDMDSISALTEKRYKMWEYLNNTNFLTEQEKRTMMGFN